MSSNVKFKSLSDVSGKAASDSSGEKLLLIDQDYHDKRAASAIKLVHDSLVWRDGLYPHVLADRLLAFIQKWQSSEVPLPDLLTEGMQLIDWATDQRRDFIIQNRPTDNIVALVAQVTMNFMRSVHLFSQVASDYADVPSFYGRPKIVEMRLCRDLGGFYDHGDHIHQGTSVKNSIRSFSHNKYFSGDSPDCRPVPYFPCRRSENLSVQAIANLFGTTVDWVNKCVNSTIAELGEEMIARGISHDDVLEVFGR